MLKTMSENELKRVLSNPQNLIVSNSLKDRIDFGDENTSPEEYHTVIFVFSDKEFKGRFSSVNKSNGISTFNFYCQEEFLEDLLRVETSKDSALRFFNSRISGNLETFEISVVESELLVKVSISEHN